MKNCYHGQQIFQKNVENQRKNKTAKRRSKFSQGTRYLPLTQIDLHLFGTWGQTAIAHAYFMENIIMFIPFGVLVPMVFKRMRNLRFCVFVGFVCSCGIELSQLITQRGYCQLDDVVTNTAGMLIGWIIWNRLNKFKRKIKLLVRKEENI